MYHAMQKKVPDVLALHPVCDRLSACVPCTHTHTPPLSYPRGISTVYPIMMMKMYYDAIHPYNLTASISKIRIYTTEQLRKAWQLLLQENLVKRHFNS